MPSLLRPHRSPVREDHPGHTNAPRPEGTMHPAPFVLSCLSGQSHPLWWQSLGVSNGCLQEAEQGAHLNSSTSLVESGPSSPHESGAGAQLTLLTPPCALATHFGPWPGAETLSTHENQPARPLGCGNSYKEVMPRAKAIWAASSCVLRYSPEPGAVFLGYGWSCPGHRGSSPA